MLSIEQASAVRSGAAWQIAWRVINPDPEPREIRGAWLPHSGFRSAEWQIEPPLVVPAGGGVRLDSHVTCSDQAGTVVENAFLILRLADQRLFFRLRVTIQPDGSPRAATETITSQAPG